MMNDVIYADSGVACKCSGFTAVSVQWNLKRTNDSEGSRQPWHLAIFVNLSHVII